MKKVLMLVVALMMFSSAASAQLDGWLDLFVEALNEDGTIVPTSVCAYPLPMQYQALEVYLIARPPADGFRAVECKVVMPDPCGAMVAETYHPNMNLDMGEWPVGKSLSFDVCMTDPAVVVVQLSYLSLTCAWSEDCQTIVLGAHDGSGLLGGATCLTGFPPYDAAHQCDVYLNCPDYEECSPIATEEKSWGAIKSLYK